MKAPFRTPSGRLIDLSLPDPDVIDLEDVAHCLARTCRFNGAVDSYYSVATHSVYVARRLQEAGWPRQAVRAGLLHDAAEAYVGDMTSGLKRLFPEYREFERMWEHAVGRRFDVHIVGVMYVKEADLRARLSEARDLFSVPYPPHQLVLDGVMVDGLTPYEARCVSQAPDEAEWSFLAMARELGLL